MYDVENKVADLEYANQKYIVHISDLSKKHLEELDCLKDIN
jgi:hypothetical protein